MKPSFLYIEADIICVIAMIYLIIRNNRRIDQQESTRYFTATTIIFVLTIIADCMWTIIDTDIYVQNETTLYVSNIFLYTCMCLVSFCLYRYMLAAVKYHHYDDSSNHKRAAIPYILSFLIILTTPFTGWMVYLNEDMKAQPGILFFPIIAIAAGHVIYASVIAIKQSRKVEYYPDRKFYRVVAFAPLFTAIGGIVQSVFWQWPVMCYGLVATAFLIYDNRQEHLISQDSLTGLNNRNELYRVLVNKMNRGNDNPIYLFFIDLDKFKSINDRYGHNEGDRALICVADALKDAVKQADDRCFICRYGGDEFIIVTESTEDAEQIPEWVEASLQNKVSENHLNYPLQVSIGKAVHDHGEISIAEFIKAADNRMYTAKLNAQ